MNKYIIKRVLEVADYILDTKETIRETAKKFLSDHDEFYKEIYDLVIEKRNKK